MKKGRLPLFTGTYKECQNYILCKKLLNNPKFTIVGQDPILNTSTAVENTLVLKPNQIKRGFWKGILDEL